MKLRDEGGGRMGGGGARGRDWGCRQGRGAMQATQGRGTSGIAARGGLGVQWKYAGGLGTDKGTCGNGGGWGGRTRGWGGGGGGRPSTTLDSKNSGQENAAILYTYKGSM